MDKVQEKSGIILQDEYWNGNILITDDVLIPKNVKVIVAPNTNIKFLNQSKNKLFNKKYKLNYLIKNFNLPSNKYDDKISIIVQGSFIFDGLPEEFINVGNCLWNGIIYVAQGATLRLKYTKVRYSFAIICDINSKITKVDDCIIEQCCVGIVGFSKIIIKNSRINFNDVGIICYRKSFLFENKIVDNFLTGLVIKSSKVYGVNNGLLLNNVGINISKSTDIKLNNNVVNNNNVGTIVSKSNKIFINNINYNNFTTISVKNNSTNVNITGFIAGQFGIRISDFSNINIDTLLFANTNYCIMAENSSTVNISSVMIRNSLVGIIATQATQLFIKKSDFSLNSLICVLEDESFMFTGESKLNSNSFGFFIVGNNPKLYNLSTQLSSSVLEYSLRFFSELTVDKCKLQVNCLAFINDKSRLSVSNSKINVKGSTCIFASNNSSSFIVDSIIKVKNEYFVRGLDSSSICVQRSKILSVGEGIGYINDKSVLSIEDSLLYSNKRSFELDSKAKMYLKNSRLKSNEFIHLKGISFSYIYGSNVKGNIFQNNGYLDIDNTTLNSDNIIIGGMLVKTKSNKIKSKKIKIEENGIFEAKENEIELKDEFSVIGVANLISNKLNCKNISIAERGTLEAKDNEIKSKENLNVVGIVNLISNKLNCGNIKINDRGILEAKLNEIALKENLKIIGTVNLISNKLKGEGIEIDKLGTMDAEENEIELEADFSVAGTSEIKTNKLICENLEIKELGTLKAGDNEINLNGKMIVAEVANLISNKLICENLEIKEFGILELKDNTINLDELIILGIVNLITNKLNCKNIEINKIGTVKAQDNEINLEKYCVVSGFASLISNKLNCEYMRIVENGTIEAKNNEINAKEDLNVVGFASLISNKFNCININIEEKGTLEAQDNEIDLEEYLNAIGTTSLISNKLNCENIEITEKGTLEAKNNKINLKEKLSVAGTASLISNKLDCENINIEEEGTLKVQDNEINLEEYLSAIGTTNLISNKLTCENIEIKELGTINAKDNEINLQKRFNIIGLARLESNKINEGNIEIEREGFFEAKDNVIKLTEYLNVAGTVNLISNKITSEKIKIKGNGKLEAKENEIDVEEDLNVIGFASLISNKLNCENIEITEKGTLDAKNNKIKLEDKLCAAGIANFVSNQFNCVNMNIEEEGILKAQDNEINLEEYLSVIGTTNLISNKLTCENIKIKEVGTINAKDNEINLQEDFNVTGLAKFESNKINEGNIEVEREGIFEAKDNVITLTEYLNVAGTANLISNKFNSEKIEIKTMGSIEARNNEIELKEKFVAEGKVNLISNKLKCEDIEVKKFGIINAKGNEINLQEDFNVIGLARFESNKINEGNIEVEREGIFEAKDNVITLTEYLNVAGTVSLVSNKFNCENIDIKDIGTIEAKDNKIELKEELNVIGTINLTSNKLNCGNIKIEEKGNLEAQENEIEIKEKLNVAGTTKIISNKFNGKSIEIERVGAFEAKDNEIEIEEFLSASGTTRIISNKFNGKRIEIEEQCVFDVENNEFNLTDKFNVKGIAKIVSNKLNCKMMGIAGKAIVEANKNELEVEKKLEVIGSAKFISNNINTKIIEAEAFSDLNFTDTNLTSNKIILKSKCKIDNTILNLKQGIYKYGFFEFICKDSKIYSNTTCFNVEGYSNNFFNNTSLTSKDNYAIVANNTNIEFNNIHISAKKGFLCDYNVNCKINKSKAQILFNFCNVSKTNFYVDDLDLVATIPKECFFIDSFSTVNLKNINLKIDNNPIFINFLNNKPLIYLLGNSKLSVDSFSSNVNVSNKMFFLRSDDKTIFELKSINVFGLYNFLYMGMLASGNIIDSKIETRSLIISMYQNSSLNITNTELMNLENFKFLVEDNANLYIKNIKVYNGQFITMSKNSQVYMIESDLKLEGLVCDIKGNSYFKDTFSNWQINDTYVPIYAFYVQDNTNVDINSSDINVKETFLYCTDTSCSKLENVSILSETNSHMLLLEGKTKTEIINSKLNVYSLAQLKNYANIIIEKTSANIKDVVIDLIGNSKAFISKVLFKCLDKNKSTAFKVLHNSKINIEDSTVDNFYIGLKYENKKNITIENTKITGKNKMLFTNDKRFLSFSNPIQKSLLYKFQQFVLSTNNIFPLNKLYDFIYVLSITIYKIFTNKKDVQSLYLRRGMLNNWIAGSSDIDYLSILKQTELDVEYNNIVNIKRKYKKLKKLFPFYGENLIFNNKELDFYLKHGGIRSKTLKNSKLLYGKKQNLITDIIIDLKHKTDIIKEILNSYILLSNNYFYNIDIISDICFSKASVDILKYIEYFYSMKDLDKSRISYLEGNKNTVTNKLYEVLKKNIRLGKDDRDCIYSYVFNELEKLAVNFNKETILNNTVRKINVSKKGSLNLFEELEVYKNDIVSIVLDDPGLAYIVLTNSIDKNKIVSIYKQAKENYCFYNTPILFFTENIYQMLLLSNFRNNPFECYKQCNISDRYYERRFYIYKDYQYYCQKDEMLRKLIISSLAEKSVQINEIDITRKFDEIKAELYEIFVDLIQFHLCLKNGKIIQMFSSTNIIKEYEVHNKAKKAEINEILSLFESSCKLNDEEKIQKVISFTKNLKNEMIKNYE